MTAEQKPNRISAIYCCFRHPHTALTATVLKIGASLPEGPGVSLGREEDKEFARQYFNSRLNSRISQER